MFRHSRAANSVVSSLIWPKFKLMRDFMHVLITCKYKKDWIKSNQEKVETPFSQLWVNGGFLLPWTPEFRSNLPQNIMQPFPTLSDAIHKIWSRLANWPRRYSSSKVENFRHSRVSNSEMSYLLQPKIKLVWAFMPVLVTSNFDDDSIKNERASMETAFSHHKSRWEIFRHSRAANSLVSDPIWPKFSSSLPASIKRIGSKTAKKRWRHPSLHYKSMGAFCCNGNQSFHPICPKPLSSLSPIPVMLHIKFDQDWPTGFRDIQIWKCGQWWQTDDGPLVYYKLTLSAFGSGELKTVFTACWAFFFSFYNIVSLKVILHTFKRLWMKRYFFFLFGLINIFKFKSLTLLSLKAKKKQKRSNEWFKWTI